MVDFLAPDYIRHDPRAATGRAASIAFFPKIRKAPGPVEAARRDPPAIVVAESDPVIVVLRRMRPEPAATK